ncbi:hypothetical protein QCA50_011306 [Cerrena zonata]|uniref:CBS domain-containing protein n=1 Tax=Cerrena zonata TaxID=2478898 RepID=A0AAW0G640_9APHY
MSLSKRVSVSSIRSDSPSLAFVTTPNADAEEWTKTWQSTLARDLIDSPLVAVDAETTVEEACELLLSKNLFCIAVNNKANGVPQDAPFLGLFDFSDVNAFLTLAATRHKWSTEELTENPKIDEIFSAAKAGRVPVHLVCNLSEKNPLEILPHNATLLPLLSIFSRGTHRAIIQGENSSKGFSGLVSDGSLLAWFAKQARVISSLHSFFSNSLSSLNLPSLYLYSSVVSAKAGDAVLDAMVLMSDQGVSSIAVLEEETSGLLSAVSVTDIGKIVVPSQSNQILSAPLKHFISLIKEPDGSTDGADKYPVYSVLPSSTLLYTIEKLIATKSHRLFVTDESQVLSPPFAPSPTTNLSGIVSIVDILSLFARLANIPDVDPTRMQRHRRASSTSTSSSPLSGRSPNERSFMRSRSSSRTSLGRIPVGTNNLRNSVSSLESFQWAERVPK